MIWHYYKTTENIALLYKKIEPIVNFVMQKSDFKKTNPIKTSESAKIELRSFRSDSFDGHAYKINSLSHFENIYLLSLVRRAMQIIYKLL